MDRPGQNRRPGPGARPRRGHENHFVAESPQRGGNRNNNPRRGPQLRGAAGGNRGAQAPPRPAQNAPCPVPLLGEEGRNFGRGGRNTRGKSRGGQGSHRGAHGGGNSERYNNDSMRQNPDDRREKWQQYGGRSHDDSEAPQVRKLGYKTLEGLLDKDPSEVVITLASSTGLKELLNQDKLHPNVIQLLCKVLCQGCSSKTDRHNVQHLLSVIKDSKFLKLCLPRYVINMLTDPIPSRRQEYPEHIENIISLLQNMVSVFPASSVEDSSMVILVLQQAINALRSAGVSINEQTEKKIEKVQTIIQHLQEKKRNGTLRRDNYTFIDPQDNVPGESYRTMIVYPTYNEIHQAEKPFLRPNIVSARYASTNVYLDTHFRLLREDFVRPLRDGIAELLSSFDDKGSRKRRFDDIRVYFNAKIIAPVCSSVGITYKVKFDTKPLKAIRWQNSKRLLYGSLVCMSKDNFETLLFATVSDRDPAELQKGVVQLCFNESSRPSLAEIQPSDSFLMVETTAYFEAYRHVLEGLQEIEEVDLPFQKYIVECDHEVREPKYLQFGGYYDFSCLMEDKPSDGEERNAYKRYTFEKTVKFNVLDPTVWPSKDALKMDDSQLEALKLALTKEVAIIQGPPGTGKTYVGLKIVQALLNNDHAWQVTLPRYPILVVCYTNHALDQFLEGIHKFLDKGIVRVGGRSSSEILKQFTLRDLRTKREFRKNLPPHLQRAYAEVTTQLKQAETKIIDGGKHLECTMRGVLHERFLERHIKPQHWDCLQEGLVDENGFPFNISQTSVIVEWLGLGSAVLFRTRDYRLHPAFEGADGLQDDDADEDDEEEELIEIDEEADLIQADRVIDDENTKPRKKNNAVNELANFMLAMQLEEQPSHGESSNKEQQDNGWQMQKKQKKKLKQRVKNELSKGDVMTAEEVDEITDIWSLDVNTRWRLYRHWLCMFQADIRKKILQHEQQFQIAADRLMELREKEDRLLLQDARIIGMTTTGAAKYRRVLQAVKPTIVIVEEAAEVLEAHIITTLSRNCQHLILIGDHQQLRPSANVYDLAQNFNLEVSLFERLVKTNFPYVRLNYQHRMRPDIARLLTPHIYDHLENHPSVLLYENIKGVMSNLFFLEHNFPEQEIIDGRSHQNKHEAEFVVALCQYLICQDYSPSQITVLTTYTGQLYCLRKLMPSKKFEGVKVHVVDKYQGEENDIILLSLVRSNKEGRVGFLRIANRICVALSRAKKGLYCIGDMKMLGQVELWSRIIQTLREKRQIGNSLMLSCQNHPETKTLVSSAKDFSTVPEGGCSLPCEFRLECGHVCTRACHPYDVDHKQFQCMKSCQKVLCKFGHKCPQLCFKKCGSCQVRVDKVIPQCGHTQKVPCSMKADEFCCLEPCQKPLNCEHKCSNTCGEMCTELCPEKITLTLKCGHAQEEECHVQQDLAFGRPVKCRTACQTELECGHNCAGSCHRCSEGRFHENCKQPCKQFLICAHKCLEPCTSECPPCGRPCQNRCIHSQCKKKCGEPCAPCVEPCEWQCEHHKCKKLCSEPCDRPVCNKPCKKHLKCGHPCIGLCGEPCPKHCRVCHRDEVTQIFFGYEDEEDACFVQLEDCKHIFEVKGLDMYMQTSADESHIIKLKVCPKCQTPIRKNLRYGAMIKKSLEEVEKVKTKIQGSQEDIESNKQRLLEVLFKDNNIKLYLAKEHEKLFEALESRDISMNTLTLIENKIKFCSRLGTLKSFESKMDYEMRIYFKKRVAECLAWLEKPQVRFTDQQLTDLQTEIQRLTYLAELNIRCKMSAQIGTILMEEIDTIRFILENTKKFSMSDETFVKDKMENLKKRLPISGLGVSDSERVDIVKAMGLRQGHWFKCPNGHIYVITECGGAMERSRCPEKGCGEEIGGEGHRLIASNQLAREMDGASHAAWSETANDMLNFQELRDFGH
ncbi:NFX1-type zinc finger-containing protein 1 [Protopterus annectens]|uniref:NFX1-type zinc finger-containing protein 1 n=1 Tax=Protopterus annectens TaxID=7888 RepID=UPI001CF9697F|nr:NFX1-type zinc finger-containing protein 1 [Protopterus annectens]XP_043946063.1 NFX1-type zinc finger-containing protein 1 [Protopterus annectens]XP_043946064.1 NFX1-type zinc finger-containing protein 1 [Protopterus annectens]